ncbi:MAG: DUF2802 domain-containing protein [Proteobacteria bacterium]|nr:DUF2802 domain-containing protein [Pseudomonadota bacterium]
MTLLLIAASSLFLTLIVATASYRLYKLNQAQAKSISSLQNQLSTLCAGAVGTDERILKFNLLLNQLKESQNTLSMSVPAQHNYDHAIRLARKGVDIDQLIDNCNLSDEEAHLINRLHGSDDQATKRELH